MGIPHKPRISRSGPRSRPHHRLPRPKRCPLTLRKPRFLSLRQLRPAKTMVPAPQTPMGKKHPAKNHKPKNPLFTPKTHRPRVIRKRRHIIPLLRRKSKRSPSEKPPGLLRKKPDLNSSNRRGKQYRSHPGNLGLLSPGKGLHINPFLPKGYR